MGTLRIIEEASLTDVGRQRHGNEDNFLNAPPFFAVADGMGGAQAGEVASQMAVDTFGEQKDEAASPEEQLTTIAKAANRKIYEMAQQDSSRAGMGTTLIAVKVGNGEVHVGHVGDSRLYMFRDDKLEQITNDHSLVEELVRQGKLTPQEAETHPQRSVITRALGPEPDVEVDTLTVTGKDGDVFLLCSDGLSGMVPDELLEQILRSRSSLESAAQQLIDAANENGGRDNITAVLFRLGEDGEAGDEAGQTVVGLDAGATKAHAVQQDTTAARDVVEDPDATVAPPPKADAAPQPPPLPAPPPPPREATKRPSDQATPAKGPRKWPKVLLAALVVAALVVGAYFGIRSFFFIGVDNSGLLTMYRGVPYELPMGVDLYEEEYASTVPARSIRKLERERILDHQLRSRDDATDLINQRERIYAR